MSLRVILSLLMTVSVSCTVLPRDLNPSPTPLLPAQVAVGIAVTVEDHLEDPACDAVRTSFLEAAHDVLTFPWTFLMTMVAYEGSLVWGLADAVSDPTKQPDFARRFQQIRQWVPISFAGVEPSLDGKTPTVPQKCLRR